MIQWIQDHKWLSSISLSAFTFLLFGGIDLTTAGVNTLGLNFLLSLAVLFAANYPWASVLATALAFGYQIFFALDPIAGSLTSVIATITIAAFASRWQRISGLLASLAFGLSVAWYVAFGSPLFEDLFGLTIRSDTGRLSALALVGSLVVIVNMAAFLYGRFAFVSIVHVGTKRDRVVAREIDAQTSLRVAEQNERFEIARDINELIIQRVAAVISQTEGGLYAAKADPSSAIRSLERIGQSARGAHTELRRLYDMLNKSHEVSAAPPGLNELDSLVVLYRELGFNVSVRQEGSAFSLNEGAQLVLYRIIFDALENVQKHCPVGTDVSIDLSWVDEGMQVLVKDNGVEVANRSILSAEGENSGYTAEDDLQALVQPIVGPGLTAMRERCALYGGSLEATKVPGVGFTVSAIFPHLKSIASEAF